MRAAQQTHAQLGIGTGQCAAGGAELEVAAATFMDARGTLIIQITGDVIWFPDVIASRMRSAIGRIARIGEHAVILAASHTHGSPQPEPRFPFGKVDADWVRRFESTALDTVERALAASPLAVSLHYGRADADPPVAINRRRAAWYRKGARISRRVQSLPNAATPVDNRVSVLVARDSAHSVRALVVHATCHPVSLPRDAMGADYPGIVRRHLRARYGAQLPVLFLQGHCGDIRPRLIHVPAGIKDHATEILIGPRFRPSREGDTEMVGAAIAAAAERAIDRAQPLTPDFATAGTRVPLRDETGAPTGRDLDVTAWRIAPGLSIVASSGEMLSGLASPDPGVLSVGYANGMAGYIAPTSEYAGGGYEIDGFLRAFGLQRRFSLETGQQFTTARARLLAEIGHARMASNASPATGTRAASAA